MESRVELELIFILHKGIVGKEVWVDPTDEEARASNGTVVLACMPALETVTSVWQSGQMKVDEMLRVCNFSVLFQDR